MTEFIRMALAVALAASALACATMSVSSHVGWEFDFMHYRSYAWGPRDALPAADPRLDADPVFHDYMEGAVEKALSAKGFARADDGTPDLLVHYHASAVRRIDVNRIDREHGYLYDESMDTRVFDRDAGFLILDVIDARTHRLIWRGWAQDDLRKFLDSDRMAREITEAVQRIVAQLPRSL